MSTPEVNAYKSTIPFESRIQQSTSIKQKYNLSIPIILVRGTRANIEVGQTKFIVKQEIPFSSFTYSIRKKVKLQKEESLSYFVGGLMPSMEQPMGELYRQYADEDGFLYIVYRTQEDKGTNF